MENKKIGGIHSEERSNESKPISSGLVRHVLTRNNFGKMVLDKLTRQLSKERTVKELQFQHQKQKLLQQKNESQKIERNHVNNQSTCNDQWRRVSDFKCAPGKSLNRCRSYSYKEPASLVWRGGQRYWESKWREPATDVNWISKEKNSFIVNQAQIDRERNSGVSIGYDTEHMTNSDVGEVKLKRPRALSEILPPLVLPPIHQCCMRTPLQRKETHECQRLKDGAVSGCEGAGTSKTTFGAWCDELDDCRYLRKGNSHSTRQ